MPVFKSEEKLEDLQDMFSTFYVGDYKYTSKKSKVRISVADPWHFGVDPDLDPRIHASN